MQCSLITRHESDLSSKVEQKEADEFLASAPKMINGMAKPTTVKNSKLDDIE